jgi:hypothetical protein
VIIYQTSIGFGAFGASLVQVARTTIPVDAGSAYDEGANVKADRPKLDGRLIRQKAKELDPREAKIPRPQSLNLHPCE